MLPPQKPDRVHGLAIPQRMEGPTVTLKRREQVSAARRLWILETLARHGFGHLVAQLGLRHLVPARLGRRPAPYTRAERLRLAFEELGTTFIKLGQILSSRPDLLPPDVAVELAKLQDAVPQEPMHVVEATIGQELGQPPAAVFERFDPEPLGSASIGQVHAARLRTGEEVVVKVQRPAVERRVAEDLAILMQLAHLAQRRTPWGRVHDLPAMVEEFAETLRGELDYVREGRNAERIRHNLAREPAVRVPAVYWPYTTRRILTMERIPGIKISDTAALQDAGVDLPTLSATLLRLSLKMVLEDGFFQADPHPGNLVVAPDGGIGLLDFGMVGSLDRQTCDDILYLLLAVVGQDIDRVVDQLLALGVVGTTLQLEHMKRDIGHLLSPSSTQAGQGADVRRFIEGLLMMAYRRQLLVPPSLILMNKTIMMHEALARTCDPECDTAGVLGQYARQVALRATLPDQQAARLMPALLDLHQLALTLPRRLRRILLQTEQGHISVNIRIQEAEHILESLNRMVNRLTLAIVAAGLVVGMALLLQTFGAAGLQWLVSAWLLAGFAAAIALAVWVVVAVLRRRHH